MTSFLGCLTVKRSRFIKFKNSFPTSFRYTSINRSTSRSNDNWIYGDLNASPSRVRPRMVDIGIRIFYVINPNFVKRWHVKKRHEVVVVVPPRLLLRVQQQSRKPKRMPRLLSKLSPGMDCPHSSRPRRRLRQSSHATDLSLPRPRRPQVQVLRSNSKDVHSSHSNQNTIKKWRIVSIRLWMARLSSRNIYKNLPSLPQSSKRRSRNWWSLHHRSVPERVLSCCIEQ